MFTGTLIKDLTHGVEKAESKAQTEGVGLKDSLPTPMKESDLLRQWLTDLGVNDSIFTLLDKGGKVYITFEMPDEDSVAGSLRNAS